MNRSLPSCRNRNFRTGGNQAKETNTGERETYHFLQVPLTEYRVVDLNCGHDKG